MILIKLWFLFMVWHSATNWKVSKFSSLLCIYLRNYWSSSNCDFYSYCDTLQLIAKFQNFLHFFAFFSRTTGLDQPLILFILWYSAANCKVSKFSSLLCIFLRNYWSSSNFDFCSCCDILQLIAKFPNFHHFYAFFSGTTGLHQTVIFVNTVTLCS